MVVNRKPNMKGLTEARIDEQTLLSNVETGFFVFVSTIISAYLFGTN